ncbi:Efflux pump roqT [Penicillium rolfsii]|nr:Efflux pump roqT [Penicillium rolfsii]
MTQTITTEKESTAASTTIGSSLSKSEDMQTSISLQLVTVLTGIGLAIFLGALDMNIVATAIPSITDEFHSSGDSGWYGSAYLLTLSSLQLSWGRLYKTFQAKWIFLSSLTIFEVGSLVCGLAPSSTVFIIGRAIAGIGIAGTFSGAMIIASYTIPLRFRPIVNSIIAVLMGSTRALGPVIGGAFVSTVGWRWCFYVNLPCGAACGLLIALGASLKQVSDSSSESWTAKIRSFDWIGLLLWAPFTVCLLLILQFGGASYAWNSPYLIALYILTVIFLTSFIYSQIFLGQKATVPPRIMKQRSMVWGSLYEFLIGGLSQMVQYFLPIFFQTVQRKSALTSGTSILPLLLSYTLTLTLTGLATTAVGKYTPFMHGGSAVLSVGLGLLSTLTARTSLGQSIGYQIICGVGLGLALDGPQLAAQTVFEQSDVPIALTVVTTLMNLGGAVFVSVGSSIFNNRVTALFQVSGPAISGALAAGTGLTDLVNSLPAAEQNAAIDDLQTVMSNVFQCGIAIAVLSFVVSFGVEWLSLKSKKNPKAADEEIPSGGIQAGKEGEK